MEFQPLNFELDNFGDIIAKDGRYNARAYTLLCDTIGVLSEKRKGGHFNSFDLMEEFKENTLDHFGPMAFTVLREWGVNNTRDIGNMMFNLVDSGRISKDDDNTIEDFETGYDFTEAFLSPYET